MLTQVGDFWAAHVGDFSTAISNVIEKKRFLESIFEEEGSWDRARAIEKWFKLEEHLPSLKLSSYEQTLVNTEAQSAYDLIFAQIKKGIDFDSFDGKLKFDHVLMRKTDDNFVELIVPKLDYLKKEVLPSFQQGYQIAEDPFKLHFANEFMPNQFDPFWEKLQLIFGIIILVISVVVYLWELRSRKREAIKKISFLNQLVHEVKTPITGIRLNADLLKRYEYDEKILEALLKSSVRLHEFFEDIVLINKNDHKLCLSTLDGEKWGKYINDFKDEFGKRITFEDKVVGDVHIDRVRVRIIVRNLLKNAIRYGGGGTCLTERDNDGLLFTIKDNGPGVSEDDSKKIFAEFFRGKNASPDGLGIGLSIVKNLTSDIRAKVKLENPGQKNAIFTLRIDS